MIIISASNAMLTSFQRGFNVSLIIRVLRDTSLIVLDWPLIQTSPPMLTRQNGSLIRMNVRIRPMIYSYNFFNRPETFLPGPNHVKRF